MAIPEQATPNPATETLAAAVPRWPLPLAQLGPWRFYFFAKLLLYWRDLIGFHPWENLAFAGLLLLPAPGRVARRCKTGAAIVAAGCLLYYDSWLPPISRAFSQASLLSNFSMGYLIELAGRFVSWPVVSMLVVVWLVYRAAAEYLRLGIVVFLLLGGMALTDHPQNMVAANMADLTPAAAEKTNPLAGLDDTLKHFYAAEAQRSVIFPKPADTVPPFDVIFLHVCSLSWDDVMATGLDTHPLWQRFDITLTQFNSAASYSGPAAIRINRATCGQTAHTDLYSPAPEHCYLSSALRDAGFEPQLLLNHDGHFDDFLKLVQQQGSSRLTPLPISGLPVPQHGFDDSPIYEDMAVLNRWLDTRHKSTTPRVSLYYNTISLHDGNRLSGADQGRSSLETYKPRLGKLLDDFDHFMEKIESSGRRAIVVLIPEHGAAIRGDRMQIAGLREIPSPAITHVPVGIKVIGGDARRQGDPLRIDQPTSYLAVSHIMAKMLEQSPFDPNGFNPGGYVQDLPTTISVAENEGTVVMNNGGRYYVRQGKDGWSEYSISVDTQRHAKN